MLNVVEGGRSLSPKTRAVISFIDANLHRDIYVEEVAQRAKLSRSRLSHLFKTEVGISLTQYLKKRRMEKARRLLETSFEPVKSVSIEVGYNDSDYFEREFKKASGSTPSGYRTEYLTRVALKKKRARKKSRILQ